MWSAQALKRAFLRKGSLSFVFVLVTPGYPSPVNFIQVLVPWIQLIRPDSLLRVYKPQQGVDIVTSLSPSDDRGRFGSLKPSREQSIWGPNPKGQNQGGFVPLRVSVFTPSVSPEGASGFLFLLPVALEYRGHHIPRGIKDFCG